MPTKFFWCQRTLVTRRWVMKQSSKGVCDGNSCTWLHSSQTIDWLVCGHPLPHPLPPFYPYINSSIHPFHVMDLIASCLCLKPGTSEWSASPGMCIELATGPATLTDADMLARTKTVCLRSRNIKRRLSACTNADTHHRHQTHMSSDVVRIHTNAMHTSNYVTSVISHWQMNHNDSADGRNPAYRPLKPNMTHRGAGGWLSMLHHEL